MVGKLDIGKLTMKVLPEAFAADRERLAQLPAGKLIESRIRFPVLFKPGFGALRHERSAVTVSPKYVGAVPGIALDIQFTKDRCTFSNQSSGIANLSPVSATHCFRRAIIFFRSGR